MSSGIKDIKVQGITKIGLEDISKATRDDKVIKLIGSAELVDGEVQLSVAPKLLDKDHPLASVNGSEKAISYMTDTMDQITVMAGGGKLETLEDGNSIFLRDFEENRA